MKQLTDEIRLAIFQQNIGSDIQITDLSDNEYSTLIGIDQYHENHILTPSFPEPVGSCVLLKRPLSSITDKEAKEVANIFGLENAEISRPDNGIILSNNTEDADICIWFDGEIIPDRDDFGGNGHPIYLHAYQYLHSRGFALSYLDWSVEELVKKNVYKLTEK